MCSKDISPPLPGNPVRGSQTGSPIMALFDLLGRRWALGALWQLCEHGPATFRELQERCDAISPSVLNTRLKELRTAGLVTRSARGYTATEQGAALYRHLTPLRDWSHGWARALASGETETETGMK